MYIDCDKKNDFEMIENRFLIVKYFSLAVTKTIQYERCVHERDTKMNEKLFDLFDDDKSENNDGYADIKCLQSARTRL